jgi:hypothetical protein
VGKKWEIHRGRGEGKKRKVICLFWVTIRPFSFCLLPAPLPLFLSFHSPNFLLLFSTLPIFFSFLLPLQMEGMLGLL